jgi:hypothetical protein
MHIMAPESVTTVHQANGQYQQQLEGGDYRSATSRIEWPSNLKAMTLVPSDSKKRTTVPLVCTLFN